MDRYHYHTRAGCGAGGKSTGGAASPLEGPELLLGWGKRKRLRCVKFSRKKSAVAVASAAVIRQKVMATPMDRQAVQSEKEQAAPGSRRNSSASHRVLSSLLLARLNASNQKMQKCLCCKPASTFLRFSVPTYKLE